MTNSGISDLMYEFFTMAIQLAGPPLLLSMLIGILIAIIQAATQIHEQTISFAPKAVAVGLTLFFLAPWMIQESVDFVNFIFEKIAAIPIT